MRTKLFITCFALAITGIINSQTIDVDVNLNINHKVDTVTTFDRNKFVVMHADVIEPEWGNYGGTNAIADVRNDFLNGYDVYLGRNSGPATNAITNATENPLKPGYALESSIQSLGNSFKTYYDATDKLFADRNNIVAVGQITTWPFNNTDYTKFKYSQTDTPSEPFGTATGEALSDYLTYYYGGTGQPKPKYFEIVNEPLYDLIIKHPNESDPATVFKYHRTVAQIIKNDHPDVDLGGYCVAFPNFDENNFSRWEERWKMFVDTAGEYMDFWSIHLYDFPTIGGKEQYRKGSNMEATFDMLDQYSMLELGHTNPYVVSEFGASVHDYQGAWSPYRDWLHMKSVNSMMMQFMERPTMINKAVNFLIIKATWGTAGVNNTYPHRLLRMANEPTSLSGQWVYSEMVKTYQLWQNVNGKRVDTYSADIDVLTDAYVEGNKAYVILNNLDFVEKTININLKENNSLSITALNVKDMYLDDTDAVLDQNAPKLDDTDYTSNIPTQFSLKPEGTIILEYTLSGTVTIDDILTETKYFSDDYYKEITAGTEYAFNINGVTQGSTYDETVLRVGIGRSHSLSKKPTVTVNGTVVEVPNNFRGDNQEDRAVFFGVLEIPVPNYLIGNDNDVKISFNDDGGYISSVTMQNYVFDAKPFRSDAVSGVDIYPSSLSLGVGQERQLTATIAPATAVDKRVTWSSDNGNVTVDADGKITGAIVGDAVITAITADGGFVATCSVKVESTIVPVLVDTIIVTPSIAELVETKTQQLSYEVLPIDADDKSITWEASNANATVDQNGLVTAMSEGSVEIRVLGANNIIGACNIDIIKRIPGKIEIVNEDSYSIIQEGASLYVECSYTASTREISSSAMQFDLNLLDSDGKIVKNYRAYDATALEKTSGTASAIISSKRASATDDLPAGQYYELKITMIESDGNVVAKTIPVIVGDVTGASDTPDTKVFIFPNPATDMLNISGLNNEEYSVNIYSMQGTRVLSVLLDYSMNQHINIDELPEGVYLLNVSGENINKTILLKK